MGVAGAAGGLAAGFTEEDEVGEAFPSEVLANEVLLCEVLACEVLTCEVLTCEVLARRDFLRNGLVCLATLSHSARSSSLSTRLRGGGGSDGSGIDDGTRRFIGGSNDA
jgi:hypothetical protein